MMRYDMRMTHKSSPSSVEWVESIQRNIVHRPDRRSRINATQLWQHLSNKGIPVFIINVSTMFRYSNLRLQLDDFCGQGMKQQEELILYADGPISVSPHRACRGKRHCSLGRTETCCCRRLKGVPIMMLRTYMSLDYIHKTQTLRGNSFIWDTHSHRDHQSNGRRENQLWRLGLRYSWLWWMNHEFIS
jgi:hypothetical protein